MSKFQKRERRYSLRIFLSLLLISFAPRLFAQEQGSSSAPLASSQSAEPAECADTASLLGKVSSRIRNRSSPGNRAMRTIPSSPARSRLSKALRLRIKVRIRIRVRNQRGSSPNESSA